MTPDGAWMNDSHGVFFLDGRYHLFFQRVPECVEWRHDIHWGYATSDDLLHSRLGSLSIPYVVTTASDDVRLSPHPAVSAARLPCEGLPGLSLDIEWTHGPGAELALVGSDGRKRAMLQAGDGRILVKVSGQADPIEVIRTSPRLRVIVDAPVLEVVADGGLVALPLDVPAGGFVPIAEGPGALDWWHL